MLFITIIIIPNRFLIPALADGLSQLSEQQ